MQLIISSTLTCHDHEEQNGSTLFLDAQLDAPFFWDKTTHKNIIKQRENNAFM